MNWENSTTEEKQEYIYHLIIDNTNYTFTNLYPHEPLIFYWTVMEELWENRHNRTAIRILTNIAITCHITDQRFDGEWASRVINLFTEHNLPEDHPLLDVIIATKNNDLDPTYRTWATIILNFYSYPWVSAAFDVLLTYHIDITDGNVVDNHEKLLAGTLYYCITADYEGITIEDQYIPLDTIHTVFSRYPQGFYLEVLKSLSGDEAKHYVEAVRKEHTNNESSNTH